MGSRALIVTLYDHWRSPPQVCTIISAIVPHFRRYSSLMAGIPPQLSALGSYSEPSTLRAQ